VGQDPYGNTGDFTPYQPDATPDGEEPEAAADAPYVPYGGAAPNVPYGGTTSAAQFYAPIPATTGRRVLPWIIGVGVLIATCGGGVAAVIGSIAGSDSDSGSQGSSSGEVYVNDLQAGQCLIGAGFATDEPVSGLGIVDCSTAHDAQVLDVNVLDSKEAADYDFDDPASSDRSCNPVLSDPQKELLQGREYGLTAFTETGSPGVGDKVACLVTRTDGQPIHEFLPAPTPEPPVAPSEVAPS